MSNEAFLYHKKAGIQEESDWAQGTVTDATKLLPLRDNGIVIGLAPQQIMPRRLTGGASLKDVILGTLAPAYTLPCYGYPQGALLLLLKALFGQVTSTEVASFTVSATNKYLDFNIGAGALAAQIATGSYAMGTADTEAGTLCAAIKAALFAADATGTYTVTYSRSTRKVTIARSTGTFSILWNTGTNKANACATLLGYATTADDTGGLSYTADTALTHVFSHVFQPLDALTYGLSAGFTGQLKLADEKVFDLLDSVADAMSLSFAPNQELWLDFLMEARQCETSSADLASLTAPSQAPLKFNQLVLTALGTTVDCAALKVDFRNNLKKDLFVNSQYRSKFPRNGMRDVSGSFTLDITDANAYAAYAAMLAGTSAVVSGVWTGSAIKAGASSYSITAALNQVYYNLDAVPGGGGQEAPMAEIPFIATDDETNGELKVTVVNDEYTVAG